MVLIAFTKRFLETLVELQRTRENQIHRIMQRRQKNHRSTYQSKVPIAVIQNEVNPYYWMKRW